MKARAYLILSALVLLPLCLGCGGASLLAYIGGGLPPGDGDIGGVVLAAAPAQVALAATNPPGTVPVVGAEVLLHHGESVVGRTLSGEGGYFLFRKPPTGKFWLEVHPPQGSGLREDQEDVEHEEGYTTFLSIVLVEDADDGDGQQ